MILNFSVRNFGSIKEKQTLSFEADKSTHLEDSYIIKTVGNKRILKLALIYGANASGKTTVLMALKFLRDLALEPEEKKTDELDFNPFLFDEETPNQNSVISIEFIQNEVKYYYEVEFFKKAIINERLDFYSPNKANVFKRQTDLKNQLTKIQIGNKIKSDKSSEKSLASNTLWNNTVLGGFLKTNIDIQEIKEVIDWFVNYLNPLVFSRTSLEAFVTSHIEKGKISKNDVINILKKADFNISDISIDKRVKMPEELEKIFKALDFPEEEIEKMKNNPPREIVFEHKINDKKYDLPMKKESEGTRRYYGFAGLLALLIKDSIALPIDELEASLHPDLYIHFILSFLINSEKSQVIATTHNREILNNKDIFRNDSIWFTDKSENCSTELYSLIDFDSSVIRDTSNILNAYKSGKLKGNPNLGDYYIELVK
jgi:AAA15 family ATPase/GTPase